jgi:hypothetical protein
MTDLTRSDASGVPIPGPSRDGPRARAVEAMLLLGILAPFLAFNLYFAFTLQRLGVTGQFNVIFDTDLLTRVSCFATGWAGFGRNLVHPNLCNMVNPVVRIVAYAVAATGLHANNLLLRQDVSLFVAPLTGAAQLVILNLTFRTIGLSHITRTLLVLLYALSFSFLIFASVPDHFVLGGLSIMLSLFAAVKTVTARKTPVWLWGIAGFLAMGVTITNAISFFFLLACSHLSVFDWKRALRKTVAICILAAAATGIMAIAMGYVYNAPAEAPSRMTGWVAHYFRDKPLENFASFPLQIGSAVAPSGVMTEPNTFLGKHAVYHFQIEPVSPFARLSGASALQIAFVLAVLAGLLAALRGRRGNLRLTAMGCGLVLLFNGVLHAVWGGDYFLFSQHWLGAAFVLTGCLFAGLPKRVTGIGTAALTVLVIGISINSAMLIADILKLLRA